ncbi:MAG: hypothetical protein PVG67_20055 [Desulfobacterales bacterium]
MLLESGREFGLTPCGLAARDSLRAGAVLPPVSPGHRSLALHQPSLTFCLAV